jgi:PKD repeat protein
MFKILRPAHVALVGIVVAAIGAAGCSVSEQQVPSLTGPSEFGTSIALSAGPEILPQDGVSQSFVTATVRDTAGRPQKEVALRWSAITSGTNAPVALNTTTSLTDAKGEATVVVTAPRMPALQPFTPETITVQVAPVSGDAAAAYTRFVTIRLQPPATATNVLAPRFTVTPVPARVGVDVRFDASASTTPEYTVITRYVWNFGDGAGDVTSTPTTSHVYTEERVYPVTLTITNNAGNSAQVGQSLSVLP